MVAACQSGPNCHVSSPTLFGARDVRASPPLFNNCGNKIGGQRCWEAPRRVLLHQHETQTSPGRATVINAVLSGQPVGPALGWQEIKQRFRVPELRRRRCKIVDCTGRMRHSTHEHGASEGYRTPAVHSRSVRDVVSFRRLDHVSEQD